MSTGTAIEWTDATWNPTTGCDRITRGCDNCYALKLAKRLKAMGQPKYQRDGDPRTSGPGFGLAVHPEALDEPLHWRTPRRVFVNSMSDLFHARVPLGFLVQVWAVMAATPHHSYQVLTKRPVRAARTLTDLCRCGHGHPPGTHFRSAMEWAAAIKHNHDPGLFRVPWPLDNVWLGTSIEDDDQTYRADLLRETPAAVRFLSLEPLLGPLPSLNLTGIDWVIVGGESGPGARRLDPVWVRDIHDLCALSGVPFFFKQTGSVLAREWGCTDRKGHSPDEWPEPFPRQYPESRSATGSHQ